MGGRTTTNTQQVQQQRQNVQNTYAHVPGAQSADIDAVRDFEFGPDPTIPYTFARARRGLEAAYNQPFGGYDTPALRQAKLAAGTEDLAQEEAQAHREDNYGHQAIKYGQLTDVAGMTAPRFVQTGSSGESSGTASGTSTQSQPILPQILQGAAGVGSALLM